MTRQEANYKILAILESEYQGCSMIYPGIKVLIDHYPDQRFGQIICNYVCPDYRINTTMFSSVFMKLIFPIDYDPFFEESIETLERLSK